MTSSQTMEIDEYIGYIWLFNVSPLLDCDSNPIVWFCSLTFGYGFEFDLV